jgi:hypothetical protein
MERISVPLFVMLPRKTKEDKKAIINLNNYRNWQFFVNNQIKQAYKESLKNNLKGLKFFQKISLTFVYYKGSNRKSDRSNVLSIHEKFFCDALTEYGCIPDDNDDFIEETRYRSGGLDKNNPRVEVLIN